MLAAGADVNLRLFTAEEHCTVILGRSREQSKRAVMSRPAREGMGEEWAGRMDGDPGAHAAGQDWKWANPILEKVAPHKYRRSIRSSKQTNSRPGRSVSHACTLLDTTVDVHLHLAAATKETCIPGLAG